MGILSDIREGWQDRFGPLAPLEQPAQKDFDYSAHEARTPYQAFNAPNLAVAWTDRAYQTKAAALLSNSVAKTCIAMRATAISNIDLLVDPQTIPLAKALLDSPNHRQPTLQAFLNISETTLSIGGNLWWFWDLGLPRSPKLYTFRPDFVKNDVENRCYLYDPSGSFGRGSKPDFRFYYDAMGKTERAERLNPQSGTYSPYKGAIQYVGYYDPTTASGGAGAGDSALRAVDILNSIDGMLHRKFKAGGNKAGFFQIPGNATDADIQTMKTQLAALNADGDLNVLPSGMSFNSAQLTFQEMNVLEVYAQQTSAICTAFRTPPELVADVKSTYANKRGADKIFYRNFIGPEAHWLVGQLQSGLRSHVDPAATIGVDETSIQHLEDDRIEKATKMSQMKAFKVNEVRAAMGFEPLTEGGDEIVGAEVNEGQPETKPKGPVAFNADAGNRGDDNEPTT